MSSLSKMSRSSWVGLVGAVATLIGVLVWMIVPAREVSVSSAAVTTGPIDRPIFATGTLQAVTSIEVNSLVSGVVQSLGADYNALVHAGDVLVRINPAALELQLASARAAEAGAEADVLEDRAALAEARVRQASAETLAGRDVITQADLDAARLDVKEAEAVLKEGMSTADQAKAAVDEVEVNLSHTVIRSPINGIVLERDIDVGQTVNASFQSPILFRIVADLSRMQVRVDVDEADIADVAKGDQATFTVDAYPGKVFRGTVASIRMEQSSVVPTAASAGPTGTTAGGTNAAPALTSPVTPNSVMPGVVEYTTLVDVANPQELLRPGMTAVVTLGGEHVATAVRIPNSALMFRPSPAVLAALGEREPQTARAGQTMHGTREQTRQVWEFDGKRLVPIAVRVGLADDGWTELRDGAIHEGDALVTSAVVQKRG